MPGPIDLTCNQARERKGVVPPRGKQRIERSRAGVCQVSPASLSSESAERAPEAGASHTVVGVGCPGQGPGEKF
jgi:hypothetical protein